MSVLIERSYWDNAAADPDVEQKYIANIPLEPCLDQLVPYLKPYSVLEIGCGIGRLTEAVAKAMPTSQIHGIDISENMLKLTPKSSVKYRTNNGRKIPYSDQSFDSIYSMLVFQHIPDTGKVSYIKEAYRALKKHGVFRFQYVEGEHHADIDHNTNVPQVTKWLFDAGFKEVIVTQRIVFDNWTWVTAFKEEQKP